MLLRYGELERALQGVKIQWPAGSAKLTRGSPTAQHEFMDYPHRFRVIQFPPVDQTKQKPFSPAPQRPSRPKENIPVQAAPAGASWSCHWLRQPYNHLNVRFHAEAAGGIQDPIKGHDRAFSAPALVLDCRTASSQFQTSQGC
jgi:hypothetical protein